MDVRFPSIHEETDQDSSQKMQTEKVDSKEETSCVRYRHVLTNFQFMTDSLAIGLQRLDSLRTKPQS
jgi:hypothetical protein